MLPGLEPADVQTLNLATHHGPWYFLSLCRLNKPYKQYLIQFKLRKCSPGSIVSTWREESGAEQRRVSI